MRERLTTSAMGRRWAAAASVASLAVVLLPALPDIAQAQARARQVRWLVSASTGRAVGASTSGLEEALRQGGWADTSPPACLLVCTDPQAHPRRISESGTWTAMVSVRLPRNLLAALTLGQAKLDRVIGHAAPRGGMPFGTTAYLGQSASFVALLGGAHVRRDMLWVAAGPALHRAELESVEPANDSVARARGSRVGGLLAAGTELRLPSVFVVQLQAQLRVGGSVRLGPLQKTMTDGGPPKEIPAADVKLTHGALLIGIGARY